MVTPWVVALLLICAPSPIPAAEPAAAELRAKVERLRAELKQAEAALARVDTPTTAAPPNSPTPPLAASPSPAPPSRAQVEEASNRFLDYLIVIAFFAVAFSFIAARYRDSQLPRNPSPESAGSSPEVSVGSGAVVFYARDSAPAPVRTEVAAEPTPAPSSIEPDSAGDESDQPEGTPSGTESAESDPGSDEPISSDPKDDLRVEPKRKTRPRSKNS
jgi:hypothetical protein